MPFGRLERWKLGLFAPFSVIRFWELGSFGGFKYFLRHGLTPIEGKELKDPRTHELKKTGDTIEDVLSPKS
jgi:hypothetical protein